MSSQGYSNLEHLVPPPILGVLHMILFIQFKFPFHFCDQFSLPTALFTCMLMMARPASVITKTLDVAEKLLRRKDQHYAWKMTSRWAADSRSISESLGFPMKRTAQRG